MRHLISNHYETGNKEIDDLYPLGVQAIGDLHTTLWVLYDYSSPDMLRTEQTFKSYTEAEQLAREIKLGTALNVRWIPSASNVTAASHSTAQPPAFKSASE